MYTKKQIEAAIEITIAYSLYVNRTKRKPERAYEAIANGFPIVMIATKGYTYEDAEKLFEEKEAERLEILKTLPQEIVDEVGSMELLFYGKLPKKAIEMLEKYKENLYV